MVMEWVSEMEPCGNSELHRVALDYPHGDLETTYQPRLWRNPISESQICLEGQHEPRKDGTTINTLPAPPQSWADYQAPQESTGTICSNVEKQKLLVQSRAKAFNNAVHLFDICVLNPGLAQFLGCFLVTLVVYPLSVLFYACHDLSKYISIIICHYGCNSERIEERQLIGNTL